MRGEDADTIAAAVSAMRAVMIPVESRIHLISMFGFCLVKPAS